MNSPQRTNRIERWYLMLVLTPPVLVVALLVVGVGKEIRAYNAIVSEFDQLAPDQRPSLTAVVSGQPDQIADKVTQAPQARLQLAAEELRSHLTSFSSDEATATDGLLEAGAVWPDFQVRKKISDVAEPIIEQMLRADDGRSTDDFRHVAFDLIENKLRLAVYEDDHQKAIESLGQLSTLVSPRDQQWSYPTQYFDKYNGLLRALLEIGFWQDTGQLQVLRNQLESVPKLDEQWEQQRVAQRTMVLAVNEFRRQNGAHWAFDRDRFPFGVPYEAQLYNLNLVETMPSDQLVGSLEYSRDFIERNKSAGGLSSMTLVGIPNADLRSYQTSWVHRRLGSIVHLMAMREYQRKITQAMLAVKQFQLQEQRWPEDLQELSRVGLGPNDMKVSRNVPIRYERSPYNDGAIVYRYQSIGELFRATKPQRNRDADEPKRDSMMIKHHVK